jgi:uncharacterized membrane protein
VIIVYDNRFDANEWFVLCFLLAGFLAMAMLPKRFSFTVSAAYFLSGVFIGLFFDHTLSFEPFDFYDVNDRSAFEYMDFLSYVMYGPFSYFFMYLLDVWKIKPAYSLLYVLPWAAFAMGMEWIGVKIGLYHYKNGYTFYYSLPIYILVQSGSLVLFYAIQKRSARAEI